MRKGAEKSQAGQEENGRQPDCPDKGPRESICSGDGNWGPGDIWGGGTGSSRCLIGLQEVDVIRWVSQGCLVGCLQ